MTRLGAFEYYFRPKLDRRTNGFGLNVAVCPPNESHPVHEHTHPGIVVVLQGEYIEEFEGRKIVLPPFTARYRPAHAVHSHQVGPAGATALHLEFSEDWLLENGCEQRHLQEFLIDTQNRVARSSIQTLLALGKSDCDGWQDSGLEVTERLLFPVQSTSNPPGWLLNAKELVDERFSDKLLLADVAKEVGISKMHLASTFRRHYGSSIIEYINQKRLELATSMILDGCQVGEAAIMAGFFDNAYFTKRFLAEFGDRPSRLLRFNRQNLQ